MSSILIACYPKVGSQYVSYWMRKQSGRRVWKGHRHMHREWLETKPDFLKNPSNKIIYLCADPRNAVLSYLNKYHYHNLPHYDPNQNTEKIAQNNIAAHDNMWATAGADRPQGLEWFGETTWDGIPKLKHHRLKPIDPQTQLSPERRFDIRKNFVSYIVNGDLLGYQDHFDSWTKTNLPYDRCILRYEYLHHRETIRRLEEFIELPSQRLKALTDRFKPRKTKFVACEDPTSIEYMLQRTYGSLASEIEQLQGFTRLPRG